MKIKVGEKLPSVEFFIIDENKAVKKINLGTLIKDQKAIIIGVPGAFTNICSAKHLPGYVDSHDKYQAKGVDLIVCISVNDPFVMEAWGKSQNVKDKVLMMADPFLSFTKAIGADVDKSARGLGVRSNRYTMLIDNLKVVKLQEEEDAGACEVSAAQNFLNLV